MKTEEFKARAATILSKIKVVSDEEYATRQSPSQRLESALKCIQNPMVRLKIRRIVASEAQYASVFWDEDERQVELIADDWEMIIRERELQQGKPSPNSAYMPELALNDMPN